ncbi:MAG: hypothetical protein JSS32_06070 [Verrucomicrobia bacterium]|nr:hypothetical protein [Verrucomicrobiota bacterium]
MSLQLSIFPSRDLTLRYRELKQFIKSYFHITNDVKDTALFLKKKIDEFAQFSTQKAPKLKNEIQKKVEKLTVRLNEWALTRQVKLTTEVLNRHCDRVTVAEGQLENLKADWQTFQQRNCSLFDSTSRAKLHQIQKSALGLAQLVTSTEKLKSHSRLLKSLSERASIDLSKNVELASCVNRIQAVTERAQAIYTTAADWLEIEASARLIDQHKSRLPMIQQRIAQVKNLEELNELEVELDQIQREFNEIPALKERLAKVGTPRVSTGYTTLRMDIEKVQASLIEKKRSIQKRMQLQQALRHIEREIEKPAPKTRWQRFIARLSSIFNCLFKKK